MIQKYISIIIVIFMVNIINCGKLDTTHYSDEDDRVLIVDSSNFEKEAYNSPTTLYIQFFANWCHVCKRFSETWRQVAKDTQEWREIIKVGVIDCSLVANDPYCQQHEIKGYPSFLHFPANSHTVPAQHLRFILNGEEIIREMVYLIESHPNKPKDWPTLKSFEGSLEDLPTLYPYKRHFLLIFEEEDSYLGRKLILDFAKHQDKLIILHVTPDSNIDLFQQFDITDVPSAYLVSIKRSGLFEFKPFEQVVTNIDKSNSHQQIKMYFESLDHDDNRYKYVRKIITFLKFYDFYNDPIHYQA